MDSNEFELSSTQSIEDIKSAQKIKPEQIDFNKDEQTTSVLQPDDHDSIESRVENEPSQVFITNFHKITAYQNLFVSFKIIH